MIFKEIFSRIDYKILFGDENIDILKVTQKTNEINDNDNVCFFCIKGNSFDGHDVIKRINDFPTLKVIVINEVRDNYSVSEIEEILRKNDREMLVVEVDNTRKCLANAVAAYYGFPAEKMTVCGITGTKGKTTVSYIMREIINRFYGRSTLIGTNGIKIGDREVTGMRTTPEASDMNEIMAKSLEENINTLITEVSSLGLKQYRVEGINFKYACFTNLYRDHIGGAEHKDVKDYLKSKLLIFDSAENAIINADLQQLEEIDVLSSVFNYIDKLENQGKNIKLYTFGINNKSDVMAKNLNITMKNGLMGTEFDIESPFYNDRVFLSIPGKFNVYNALAAITIAGLMKIPFKIVKETLENINIPGRVQVVPNNLGISVVVDYAHNGTSLEALVKSMRHYAKGRIVVVFGCGGERSVDRRYSMGKAAARTSDFAYITTDNSRGEEPMNIVNQIIEGYNQVSEEKRFKVELDRRKAIEMAIKEAQTGDMVIIAGKGHETVQITKGVETYFSDVEVAREICDTIGNR